MPQHGPPGDPHGLRQNDLVRALTEALSGAWQAPQTMFGLARGMAKTGGLPSVGTDPQGNVEFRFNVEGEDPLALGSTITTPRNVSPEHLAHERVHTRQSRELGPAFIPMRMLGDVASRIDVGDPYLSHPMEDEAYLETADTDELLNRLLMKRAYRNMRNK